MGVVGAALRGFGRALSKKSGTITGVTPGSKIGKGRTWEDYIDTSHPSYKENP